MTARARPDRGDRRIDSDADACGIGASIQAVQRSAPARPSSPRPASSGMPGHVRTTGESTQPVSVRGGQGAPSAAPPRRRRRTTARIGSKRPRPQYSHPPAQNDPLWAAEKAGIRGARTAQIGGYACGLPGDSTTYRDRYPPDGRRRERPRCPVSRIGRSRPHSGPAYRHTVIRHTSSRQKSVLISLR